MPLPIYRNREIGLTGRFKFRRQSLTGLPVLQVEVYIRRSRYPIDSQSNDIKTLTDWRDATYEEAIRMQIDLGRNTKQSKHYVVGEKPLRHEKVNGGNHGLPRL